MITEKQVKNDPDLLAWWTAIDSRTTKDKHDLLVAKLGNRINVIELAEINGRAQMIGGESRVPKFKAMIKNLPDNHRLGLVQIIVAANGQGSGFIAFLAEQSTKKKFNLLTVVAPPSRTAKDIFNDFLKPPIDETAGSC